MDSLVALQMFPRLPRTRFELRHPFSQQREKVGFFLIIMITSHQGITIR